MALENLSDLRLEILTKKYIEGLRWEEIIDNLNFSSSSCYKEGTRGLQQLAVQLLGIEYENPKEGMFGLKHPIEGIL